MIDEKFIMKVAKNMEKNIGMEIEGMDMGYRYIKWKIRGSGKK